MAKKDKQALAISQAAGLAAKQFAALEAAAAKVKREITDSPRSLRLVSSKTGGLQVLIKTEAATVEIQDEDFAVQIG